MATVHRLEVTLRSVKPRVWRRIDVDSDITLDDLSDLLEAAMGWLGGHLHAFEVDGILYERTDPEDGLSRGARDESEHQLSDVLAEAGAKMRWDYDFGDGWQHNVVVEAIEHADATYPRCVAGRRACPPEDCGGPWGYEELLEALAEKDHPRHDELTEWLPPGWDPAHFDADDDRFQRATAAAPTDDSIVTPFEIEPYPFQRQILERLEVERRRGHPHNLVAAATGTGKTIIAALDYRNLRTELDRARLLFVAHRTEILQQSQTMFRHVLRDGAFGELWVGGDRPTRWEHVFASIQSITANDLSSIDPDQKGRGGADHPLLLRRDRHLREHQSERPIQIT